jgi:hypothetical protein
MASAILCSDRMRQTFVMSRRLKPSRAAEISIMSLFSVVYLAQTSTSKSERLSVRINSGMERPRILSKSCLIANEASKVSANAIVSAAIIERAIRLDLKDLNDMMQHVPVESARIIT